MTATRSTSRRASTPTPESARRRAAIHEAGHAAVAVALGLSVSRVAVGRSARRGFPDGRLGVVELGRHPDQAGLNAAHAAASLAGAAAEELAGFGRRDDCDEQYAASVMFDEVMSGDSPAYSRRVSSESAAL